MTPEQTFFLQQLGLHLSGEKLSPDAFPELNWTDLIALADSHQMTDILFYQCRNYMMARKELAPLAIRVQQNQASHLFTMANRTRAFEKLEAELTARNISFFPFKGAEIAKYYPIANLRSSGDIDLMMKTEDRDKVHQLMLDAGYEASTFENHEWGYHGKNAYFEIHDRMLFETNFNSPEAIAFCDRCWSFVEDNQGTSRKTLDLSFHFIYLLLHLRKHMLWEGVGFRQFYDLAVLARRAPDKINWKWVSDELDGIHLLQFGQTCMQFCEHWFGVKSPTEPKKLAEDFYAEATEKIFANGVFGFENDENAENANLNELRSSGKAKTVLHRIFPPYRDMKEVPYYSFVKGKPWLLPAAWIYRLFRSIFVGKSSDGVKLLTSAIDSDDQLKARETVLHHWGL